MARIAALEYVKYGDFTFPASHVRVKVEPVLSASHRRTKYLRVTFTINSILCHEDMEDSSNASALGLSSPFSTDTFEASIPMLLRYLSQVGRTFQYRRSILGDFVVQRVGTQSDNTHIDVEGGPKPSVMLLEPLGPDKACRLVWEVTCCIPECTSQALLRQDSLQELSYAVIWDIGDRGLTTRTVTGFYEVPLSGLLSGVDEARRKIDIGLLPGFHRTQNWRMTEDRRQMHFTLVDTEIESSNPYYPGVANMEVTQEMQNLNVSYNRWEISLQGNITLHVGANRYQAIRAFSLVVLNRIGPLINYVYTNNRGHFIKLSRLTFREGIYSRNFAFSLVCEMQVQWGEILMASGFGNPIKGVTWTDWNKYRVDLLSRAQQHPNYGPAGLGLRSDQTNVQVDCNPAPAQLYSNPVLDYRTEFFDAVFTACPPKNKSIDEFEMEITLQISPKLLSLLPADAQPDLTQDNTPALWEVKQDSTVAGQNKFVQPKTTAGTLLLSNQDPIPLVTVRGRVVRANYKPELPRPRVNGKPVQILNLRQSAPQPIGSTATGCPLYSMSFSYTFYLDPSIPDQTVSFDNAPSWWENPFQPGGTNQLSRP